MEVVIAARPHELGRFAADRIAAVVDRRPDAVLGFATGSSPIAVYETLAARVAAGELSFARARGFALDEYVGVPATDPRSYAWFIRARVEAPLGMAPGAVQVPDGSAADLDAAALRFDRAIASAGGIDLQLLGVGVNGHIGFNEPSSSLGSRTRIKTLAHQTRLDNARFFDAVTDVPTRCLTQGLATIGEARSVVLVAAGEAKAPAIAAIVEGPVTSMWPGSVLQHHPHATIIVDEAAASGLRLADYYRATAAV
ncbi:MAG: glucosamine-6-phosphate deaminase [Pseudolysinimonas sp.]